MASLAVRSGRRQTDRSWNLVWVRGGLAGRVFANADADDYGRTNWPSVISKGGCLGPGWSLPALAYRTHRPRFCVEREQTVFSDSRTDSPNDSYSLRVLEWTAALCGFGRALREQMRPPFKPSKHTAAGAFSLKSFAQASTPRWHIRRELVVSRCHHGRYD